ncbi:retrovirus-related pol polyprotein from transposon TNT 1-94 [Tanacetum coccineum]
MQDKNMVINELKKLILVTKGKYVETQFDKPSVVRQPNAQRIPKPSVLGKPTPFSNSPEMRRMYRIATTTTQNREPQLPHASRNTNPHVSKSSGVNHTTSVSRPQLKCYQVKDKVVPNNSQVKFKKKEVEDHHRISSISKKTKSVTVCNDSSNSRTSNVNVVCAECGKCVFNSNHDACVSRYLNDVNARTKKPKIVQLIIFIVDSGCIKHMTGNLKLLCNFVEKFLGTICFGNDQFSPILGYGDLNQGNVTIKQGNDLLTGNRGSDLYTISLQETTSSTPICFMAKASPTQATSEMILFGFTMKMENPAWSASNKSLVELQHFNLFSVSQICDKKNKVLFTDSECLVLSPEFKLLDANQVLLRIPRQNNMYSFNLENIVPSRGKQHKASCKAKSVSSISQPLQLLHMDLFRPTSVRSLNHKTYCLVITDDFSRFSWVFFLRTKDETSGILKDFIRQIENQLNQKVKTIRCDNGTKFKNRDFIEFCGSKGIKREYSNARTPQQNGVAERKNRTLIEAARYYAKAFIFPNHFLRIPH